MEAIGRLDGGLVKETSITTLRTYSPYSVTYVLRHDASHALSWDVTLRGVITPVTHMGHWKTISGWATQVCNNEYLLYIGAVGGQLAYTPVEVS